MMAKVILATRAVAVVAIAAIALAAIALLGARGAGASILIDVASGTGGQFFPGQSFNETRGVDVTVLGDQPLNVSVMRLDGFSVGGDGMATVGARIYSSPAGTLLAARDTTVFQSGPVTLAIAATLAAAQSYRLCFFAGPLGPGEDNSGTMFDPAPGGVGGFPYVEATGTLRINQAYSLHADAFPTNQNIFVPLIEIEATAGTAGLLDDPVAAPHPVQLYPAAPNPFRTVTTVRFALSEASPLSSAIVDVAGRVVRVLGGGEASPGLHSLRWDGTDDRGRSLAPGVYFLRLATESSTRSCRLVLR